MSKLDRDLCERLNIPPVAKAGDIDQLGGGYWILRKESCYPKLSTTGNGMVLLLEALEKHGWDWDARSVSGHPSKVLYGVFRANPDLAIQDSRRQYYATSTSAPMALALATAAALEIEVVE